MKGLKRVLVNRLFLIFVAPVSISSGKLIITKIARPHFKSF